MSERISFYGQIIVTCNFKLIPLFRLFLILNPNCFYNHFVVLSALACDASDDHFHLYQKKKTKRYCANMIDYSLSYYILVRISTSYWYAIWWGFNKEKLGRYGMRVDWWKKDNECKRLNQINMKYSVIIMVFLMFKSVVKIVLYEW